MSIKKTQLRCWHTLKLCRIMLRKIQWFLNYAKVRTFA